MVLNIQFSYPVQFENLAGCSFCYLIFTVGKFCILLVNLFSHQYVITIFISIMNVDKINDILFKLKLCWYSKYAWQISYLSEQDTSGRLVDNNLFTYRKLSPRLKIFLFIIRAFCNFLKVNISQFSFHMTHACTQDSPRSKVSGKTSDMKLFRKTVKPLLCTCMLLVMTILVPMLISIFIPVPDAFLYSRVNGRAGIHLAYLGGKIYNLL